MTPELVGIIFTGIGGLIAAFSTFNANRSKRVEIEHKYLKGRVTALERQVLDFTTWAFECQRIMAASGLRPPPLPASLKSPVVEEGAEHE